LASPSKTISVLEFCKPQSKCQQHLTSPPIASPFKWTPEAQVFDYTTRNKTKKTNLGGVLIEAAVHCQPRQRTVTSNPWYSYIENHIFKAPT